MEKEIATAMRQNLKGQKRGREKTCEFSGSPGSEQLSPSPAAQGQDLPSCLFHVQQKGTAGAEASEEAVKEERPPEWLSSSSLGSGKHIQECVLHGTNQMKSLQFF